jgi:glycosyltransferase involved in cell wall biosynthesis
MPCLNEADTLAACIQKALAAMKEAGIAGEVVVADNGSTDGSRAIAGTARRSWEESTPRAGHSL